MPLVQEPFGDIITFTRASTGTFFNSAGVLTSAAINAPRFDYNPATLAARGFLIEEARTNLITSSAVLPAGVNVTITADTFVAPDGTTTGDQILDNATLGEHYSDSSFTPVAATNYTFSAFIKNIGASSSGFAALRLAGDFSAFVIINLSTFTVATTGGAQYVSSSVQAINNGWYRITLTGVSVGTVASVARVQVTDAANLTPYSGTGKGFAVWGRQLEAGAFPTSYIPTTTTALTRSVDTAFVNTLSPWFNASASTIYFEGTVATVSDSQNPYFWSISDNTKAFGAREQIAYTRNTSSAQTVGLVAAGGATNASVASSNTAVTANTVFKAAASYAANDVKVCVNGLTPATTASATLPTGLNTLKFGAPGWSAAPVANAFYIRRFTYYPRSFAGAELQSLTA